MEMLRKIYTVEQKAIDPDNGIYEAMISTEEVDRDGDILLASGIQTDNYMKNPVVVFAHRYTDASAVVGRALEVEPIPGQGVRARWQFVNDGISEEADLVRRLWAGGFLNATSVGFVPKEASELPSDNGHSGKIYSNWEMLEFSIVIVPANASALRLAVKALDAEPAAGKPSEQESAKLADKAELEAEFELQERFRGGDAVFEYWKGKEHGVARPDDPTAIVTSANFVQHDYTVTRTDDPELTEQKDEPTTDTDSPELETHDNEPTDPVTADPLPIENDEPEELPAGVLESIEQIITSLESILI
jgi:hypothetical protein